MPTKSYQKEHEATITFIFTMDYYGELITPHYHERLRKRKADFELLDTKLMKTSYGSTLFTEQWKLTMEDVHHCTFQARYAYFIKHILLQRPGSTALITYNDRSYHYKAYYVHERIDSVAQFINRI